MYLLAIVAALWGVGNLAAGDYVEGVIGVTVAAILAAGQYFWDALGGDGAWQRLKVPVGVGVMLAGFGVVALMILEEIEIDGGRYLELERAVAEFPALQRQAARAISDGKVSIVEFHALEESYHDLARQRSIAFLQGAR
jgi:hypothetical protein